MRHTRPRAAASAALVAALSVALFAADARAQGGAGPVPQPEGGGGPGRGGKHDYDRPFAVREVTTRAAILSKPEPPFTEKARRNDTEGVVRLRAVLAHDGEVRNISVIKGLPDGLTEKAISAARNIKFRPAQKDGRAVSQWVMLEYNFNIYYDDESVERRAVILERPEPEYTEEARRHRAAGRVVLDLTLYKDGDVRVEKVVEGLPHGLTEKAVEAAEKIKFEPAWNKGKMVTVTRRVEYRFPPE